MSQDEFDALKQEPCYLCGKTSSLQHLNGVDRLDNNKGYTMDNIKACCFGCNHLKRNYVLEDMLNKFMDIYSFNITHKQVDHSDIIVKQMMIELVDRVEYSIAKDDVKNIQFGMNNALHRPNNKDMVANKNKKTDEEKREEARIRKANQRLRLKDKYGSDEYNRQKAADLAKYRKNKKIEV